MTQSSGPVENQVQAWLDTIDVDRSRLYFTASGNFVLTIMMFWRWRPLP